MKHLSAFKIPAFVYVLGFCAVYICALIAVSHTLSLSDYEREFIANSKEIFNLAGALNAQMIELCGPSGARALSSLLTLASCAMIFASVRLEFINFSFATRAAMLAALVFALCPGVFASALLLDGTALLLASVCALALAQRSWVFYPLFCGALFVQPAVIWLYLGALLHFHLRAQHGKFLISLVLLISSVMYYQLDFHGRPRGYLPEHIALCAAVLSPLLLIYYFYFIYDFFRRAFRLHESNFAACVSGVVFAISLLLSLRQKPEAAIFLPFLPIAIAPLCVHFVRSYYLHIRRNRLRYKTAAILILLCLFACDVFIIVASFKHAEFLSSHQ